MDVTDLVIAPFTPFKLRVRDLGVDRPLDRNLWVISVLTRCYTSRFHFVYAMPDGRKIRIFQIYFQCSKSNFVSLASNFCQSEVQDSAV